MLLSQVRNLICQEIQILHDTFDSSSLRKNVLSRGYSEIISVLHRPGANPLQGLVRAAAIAHLAIEAAQFENNKSWDSETIFLEALRELEPEYKYRGTYDHYSIRRTICEDLYSSKPALEKFVSILSRCVRALLAEANYILRRDEDRWSVIPDKSNKIYTFKEDGDGQEGFVTLRLTFTSPEAAAEALMALTSIPFLLEQDDFPEPSVN